MARSDSPLPALAAGVTVRQLSADEYVVKHRGTKAYYRVGEVEHFLLAALDGRCTSEDLQRAYQERYGETLTADEVAEFLSLMQGQGLVRGGTATSEPAPLEGDDADEDEFGSPRRQSWLYFRWKLVDPSRLLNCLEPLLRWMWTPGFVAASVLAVLSAALVLWTHRSEFVTSFQSALRWETVVVVWGCILGATILHELAHGLTCRHFGGDVHEIGALVIFGMPSMYCDVSDAWLIPSRTQRLWITLAGSVSDLWVFAVAIGVWRLTILDSFVNYVAWVLASVCGTRVFLNLNPLLRLDGYYLASDWWEIPNLRQSANAYWKEHLRHWLWGAPRPRVRPKGRTLLTYGATSWLFSIALLDALFLGVVGYLHQQLGFWGLVVPSIVMLFLSKRVFKGLFSSEFCTMIRTRPRRTLAWAGGTGFLVLLALVLPVDRTSTGEFEVRPGLRSEVRSEVAGFLRELPVIEGDQVEQGTTVARLEVPDLESQIVRKRAEMRESEAQLRKLTMGVRPEEMAEQREKVRRAQSWRDLAENDLLRARRAYEQDLVRLDLEIQQYETELEFEKVSLTNAERLYQLGALAGESRRAEQKKFALIQAQLAQAHAEKQARLAEGVRDAEAEVARRNKDLADTEAALKLLEAGTRPEEIEAETARRARLQEELDYLLEQQAKVVIAAPIPGTVATPRLQEMKGQYVDKGTLVCVVEDLRRLNVEIAIDEEHVAGIEPGQPVSLKARALPFDVFTATVARVAPKAIEIQGRQQNRVVVHCQVDNADGRLKSSMTGYARIYRGKQSIAQWAVRKGLGYLRTEFWW